jgi:hypothetical protein
LSRSRSRSLIPISSDRRFPQSAAVRGPLVAIPVAIEGVVVRPFPGADFTEGARQSPPTRDTLIELDRLVEGRSLIALSNISRGFSPPHSQQLALDSKIVSAREEAGCSYVIGVADHSGGSNSHDTLRAGIPGFSWRLNYGR